MRSLAATASLIFASLVQAQTAQPPVPNAIRLTKYILGVADLDRTYAFYHALGLELENGAALNKPNVLPEMLQRLVSVPAGTKFRNAMLKIPNAPFALEVTEFSSLELHPVKPRIQDPGASHLLLMVDNVEAMLAKAKEAGAEVVTAGGAPVPVPEGRGVTVRDPDGYSVEFGQAPDIPPGNGRIVGSRFAWVVPDVEKAAAFYRDQFGFQARITDWSTSDNQNLGTLGAQLRLAGMNIPGTGLGWAIGEFKDVDRKPYTPRIPDPGAAAVGLEVRDIDAAIAAVKAAGGTSITLGGRIKLGNTRVGFVRDPNGILVELAQP
jgi:catechol 2,3-dioxygenase-like lactoylglutathione lyase family enzyme